MSVHDSGIRIPEYERFPHFKIELPAKPSPDNNCMQASVGMILEDLSPGNVPDLATLESVSHKREKLGTWPGWMVSWLHDQGYSVELFSNVDWNRFSSQPHEVLEAFSHTHESEEAQDVSVFVRDHDLKEGAESTKQMLDRGLLKESEVQIEEIFKRIQSGDRVIVLLDFNHWVPLTGFDGKFIYYNDPQKEGTIVNKKESYEQFMKRAKKFDLFTVIILGKKNNESHG